MANLKASFLGLIRNKWFCLFCLIGGCLYATIFGFLYVDDPLTAGLEPVKILGVLFELTMTATSSVIGKTYVWGIRVWGVVQTVGLASNVLYVYNRYGYKSKAGKICLAVAAGCIVTCNFIPSTETFSLQLVAHWSMALLFAILNAAALGLFLLSASKKSKRVLATFIAFAGMLAAMIALLTAFGKSGAIEGIPTWGSYLILFLLGYTNLYKACLPKTEPVPEREAVTV